MRFPLLGRWEDTETGEVLVERLLVAQTFFQRLRGLQFAKPLEPNCGLLLKNCRSVHTMWMRFAIDVVFVDKAMTVLEVRRDIKPWRFVVPQAKDVSHVVEFTSGQKMKCEIGRRTEVVE